MHQIINSVVALVAQRFTFRITTQFQAVYFHLSLISGISLESLALKYYFSHECQEFCLL
jgi:hypothetical protein